MTCSLCKLFWWIGHIWSRAVLNWWPWEFGSDTLYAVYNRAMQRSLVLNDRGDCGHWSAEVIADQP